MDVLPQEIDEWQFITSSSIPLPGISQYEQVDPAVLAAWWWCKVDLPAAEEEPL